MEESLQTIGSQAATESRILDSGDESDCVSLAESISRNSDIYSLEEIKDFHDKSEWHAVIQRRKNG